jgi:methionyl-tRNA synthetase
LRVLAIVLAPYLPETTPRILAALGQDASLDWKRARAGQTRAAEGIPPAEPLFPRVDSPAAV